MKKKEAHFILKHPGSPKPTYILLKFCCKDKPLRYPTKQLILPTNWNNEFQRTFTDRKINSLLDRIAEVVEQYQETRRIFNDPDIWHDDLKRELDEKLGRSQRSASKPVKKVKAEFMVDYIQILINDAREGKILTDQGRIYEEHSIRQWEGTFRMLSKFDKLLKFDDITLDTYTNFISFCNRANMAASTIGKHIKTWKRFMKLGMSQNRKWHNNLVFMDGDFKKLRETVEKVYLDEEEIHAIKDLDLSPGSPHMEEEGINLEVIRDRFLINLYTGLRISDMKDLELDNIGHGVIVHINKKTKKKVVIPIHPSIESILVKYGGHLPKQYCDQVVNREIKRIARKADIIKKVRYTITKGGVQQKIQVEKWKLITNHTCRRSLATNLLKHATTIDVMPILGMSSKTLELYNKRSAEENAEMMKQNPFFARKKVS